MGQRIGRRSSKLLNKKRFSRNFVLKQTSGSRVNGRWVSGVPVETTLFGSIQPASPKQRNSLPEGERLEDAISVFFRTTDKDAIRPLTVGTSQAESDVIIVDGLEWWVRSVDNWFDYGHVTALCTRKEGQDG
jgi:hypothetical protein